MIPTHRAHFNREFTEERYQRLLSNLDQQCGVHVGFRLSETPCFYPMALMEQLIAASEDMARQLLDNPDYRRAADAAVPERFRVNGDESLPTFLAMDFGLVQTPTGIEGRLVELQAFASLYGFQAALAEEMMSMHALEGLTPFLGGHTRDSYLALMHRVLVGLHDPEEVVLMEIDPKHQKTVPDFNMTEQLWGIRAIDVHDVIKDGRQLWYRRDGVLRPIRRIYNRVIPDELERKGVTLPFDYRDDLDVEWKGGPDWFFRISKFSIPWLRHPWVPRTQYLNEVTVLPDDRERYLIKPLFSFAGGGVLFAPTDADFAAIPEKDRHLYILQERMDFAPLIDTPFGLTKAEIRIMFVLDHGAYRPVIPLIRMGRGKMMGVDHNKGQSWVGASAALMQA